MFRYQNNAFRIFGLKPNASMKEITKRVNEIKVKISLGINVEYDYDFHFMGPLNRDEQNILNALQRLENPILRLKEEIFWFWFETDSDIEAISYLTQDNRNGAHNIWDVQLKEGNFTEKSISAYFNQIILAHSTVIEEESKEYSTAQGKIQKKKSITLDENHWNNWQLIIDRFILLATNNLFWDMVQGKAERIADPRLSNKKVNEIRNNFLNDIVQPNFSLISKALNKKEYSTIKGHLNLFTNDSWVPGDLKFPIELFKKGFNKILSTHISLLDSYTRNAKTELSRIEKEDLDKLIVSTIELYHKLVKNAENIIYEGGLVDPNNISDFSLAKDEISEVIRQCAVILFNSLIHNQSYKDRQDKLFKSYIMIRKAIEYSVTSHSRQKIEKDEEVIKRSLEYTFGNNNFTNILNKIQKQEDEYKQKVTKEGIGKEKRFSIFNWASSIIYGFIGLALLFVILSVINDYFYNNSSNNMTNRRIPIKNSSSNSLYNNDINRLEVMIDDLEEELTIKEKRLEEMESTLESSYARIVNLETKLENLDSKINSTFLINEKNKLIDEYNQTFGEYDRLINSHNDFYSEYEKLFEEYEGEISVYNTLVDSYSTGTIPSFIQDKQSENDIEFIIYTVKVGDSLSKIAKNFSTTVEIIAEQNNLINLNVISPGQELIIPQ